MKTLILILATFSSISAFANKAVLNCEFDFKKEKLCGAMTWVKKPVVVAAPTAKDAGSFDIKFPKALEASKTLKVWLHMPDMGHGSQPVVITKDEKDGTLYHITQVLFSMEGDWEIRARIDKDGKTVDNSKVDFQFK